MCCVGVGVGVAPRHTRPNFHTRPQCLSYTYLPSRSPPVIAVGMCMGVGAGRDISEDRMGGGGGAGTQKFMYQKWPSSIFPVVNSVAYWQDTSKREGAQSVNQVNSHGVIHKPRIPPLTPK